MKIEFAAILSLASLMAAAPALAQTADTQDARSAYGARLTEPEGIEVNSRRVNNRINNRIDNRLSTRIERYTPGVDATVTMRDDSIEAAQQAVGQPVKAP